MLSQLLEPRRIETSKLGRNFCFTSDFNGSMPRLYKRGLVDTEWAIFEKKEVLKFFLTSRDISFLEEQQKNKTNGKK